MLIIEALSEISAARQSLRKQVVPREGKQLENKESQDIQRQDF
jgi:hypothetical protein